jgi:pyoverdine/dityrosine biosynthesis protein Dit1
MYVCTYQINLSVQKKLFLPFTKYLFHSEKQCGEIQSIKAYLRHAKKSCSVVQRRAKKSHNVTQRHAARPLRISDSLHTVWRRHAA